MFGVLRPCRHRLSGNLHADWVAHLCGLCLTLRDERGQFARAVTNYDGLVISALVEAQSSEETAKSRHTAGPCPLRGMRRASVTGGDGSRLAAAVSLVLASAKLRDHSDDADGAFRHRPVGLVARRTAARWSAHARNSGADIGFDTSLLTEAVERQSAVEEVLGPGDSVLHATEPTECATGAAFAHTAVLAGSPANSEALSEAGQLFGRVAHLLDAVEDLADDSANGAWNPLLTTGTSLDEAHRLCRDAVRGVRLALHDVAFTDPHLPRALLVGELSHAVRRTFGHAGHLPPDGEGHESAETSRHSSGSCESDADGQKNEDDKDEPGTDTSQKRKPPQDGDGGGCWVPKFREPPRKRNAAFGCLVASYMCCSCQFCCREPFPGPWSGQPHHGTYHCGDGCDCCNCCDCDCSC